MPRRYKPSGYGLRSKVNKQRLDDIGKAISRAHASGRISNHRMIVLQNKLAELRREMWITPNDARDEIKEEGGLLKYEEEVDIIRNDKKGGKKTS